MDLIKKKFPKGTIVQTFKFSNNGQNEHEEVLDPTRGGQGGQVGGQQAQGEKREENSWEPED